MTKRFWLVISSVLKRVMKAVAPDRGINLLDRYHLYLRSRIGKVRILGEQMDRDLQEVFVDLTIVQQERREYSDLQLLMDLDMRRRLNPFSFSEFAGSVESPDHFGKKLSPKELLRKNTRAIITGAPGGGKTTLLKYLGSESSHPGGRLVVWLELKALHKELFKRAELLAAEAGHLVLEELWIAYISPALSLTPKDQDELRRYWTQKQKSGELLVLMDGFDELQDEELESSLNNCVMQFVSGSYHNSLLITTRPYAQKKLGTEGFREWQIEPLTDSQIAAFLNSYYPKDPSAVELLRAVHDRLVPRDLLNVPLLIGILLRLCREKQLISDRLKLYELIIRDLARELDRSKSITRSFGINDDRLRLEFLKDLAFQRLLDDPHETGPTNNRLVFTYDVLKDKAESFLKRQRITQDARQLADDALATPLLRELSQDLFAFTQLTLQEYLAAQALAAFYARNEIDGLRVFCGAYYDSTLVEMEVLPMMLGGTSKAELIYREIEGWPNSFTQAKLRLRVRGLGYGAKLSDKQLADFLDQIWEILIDPSPDEQAYSRLILSSLWALPDQARQYLESKTIPCLTDRRGFKYLRAAEALVVLGRKESFDPIVNALDSGRGDGTLIAGSLASLDETFFHYASRALIRIDFDKAVTILSKARTQYSYGDLDRLLKQVGSEDAFRAIVLRQKTHTNIEWYTSKAVAEILEQSKDSSIVKALIAALSNTRPGIRQFAVSALGIIGSEEAVDSIAKHLADSDFAVRWKAATALEYIGSSKAVTPLIEALNDDASTVRWCAANALGQIGSLEAVDALCQRLSDPDIEVQYHAASALGWIASQDAVHPLLTLLANGVSPKARSAAAYAFYRIRTEQAIDGLISRLGDSFVEVRAGAAFALGGQQANKAAPILIALLQDTATEVRANAAFALGKIRDMKAVPYLIFTFRNTQDHRVRENIIRALGEIGSEQVVEPLMLAASSLFDSSGAVEALAQIDSRCLAIALPKLISHREARVRRKAIETIAYFCDSAEVLDELTIRSETDSDDQVRAASTRAAFQLLRKLELLGRDWTGSSFTVEIDNESREGILVGEVIRTVSEAGHIYREVVKNDWGIDGEIEFKDERGEASGQRVYLQLKSGDSHLYKRKTDGKEVFYIKDPRHTSYWQSQSYPVLLVIRAQGRTRFLNVTAYLEAHGESVTQIDFNGEDFNPGAVRRMSVEFLTSRRPKID